MLHIINEATKFRAAKLLRKYPGSATARATFNAFKTAWINIYLGPPDFIVYDYKTNFNSEEFRSVLRSIRSTPKLVPIKAHYFISKVKRYYRPLRRAYKIVTKEHPELSKENRLQIAVKTVNNTTGPNRLIPILLVFKAYPKITELDPPNLLVKRRAVTIKKAIKEVRRIYIIRKVNNTLGTRNGPGTTYIYNLCFNNKVIVYREKEG
ncbi:hypothetical protein DL98DRAFT_549661 [Cadophora sp. DSE1049]|nr:hypothetical protein DL98DRAFT_549661 [Cadophora sp. DSE1049]